MATITYRALDANGDPLCGNGQNNFLSDIDAVAQAIQTRLKLLQGEWWENLNDGLPLFQSILGGTSPVSQATALSSIVQQRILGTPYVTGISDVQTSYNPATRQFAFGCLAQTQFGPIQVSSVPVS